MKKLNTTFTGGLPLKQKALAYLQEGHLEILKAIIGHFGIPDVGNFIISGCEIVGANIAPGMMYLDGELCPFEGATGTGATKIKKIKSNNPDDSVTYKNGNVNQFYETYDAKVNTAGEPLSDFERLPKVNELVNVSTEWANIANKPQLVIDPFSPTAVPAELTVLQRLELLEKKNAVFTAGGAMVLWNKPANLIEPGWHEVVDWKGRIPVGVDNRLDLSGGSLNSEFQSLSSTEVVPGKTGGDKGTRLVVDNLPQITVNSNGLTQNGNTDSSPGGGTPYYQPAGNNSTTFGKAIPDKVNILNPYRTVLFIEYTGL